MTICSIARLKATKMHRVTRKRRRKNKQESCLEKIESYLSHRLEEIILQAGNSRVWLCEEINCWQTFLYHLRTVTEKCAVYQNNKWTSHKNKEAEPVQPVQMNIYQSSNSGKALYWLDSYDNQKTQERQQVLKQGSMIDL